MIGIWVGKNTYPLIEKNLEEKVQKLKVMLNIWKSRNLSIKGKITLLRTQAMPILLYPFSVLDVSKEIAERVDKIFKKII